MFFDEIYNPLGRERSLTNGEMKQARLDRWGGDSPFVLFDEDMSDKFNTQLSELEEQQFQKWAKENNRLRDAFNYDIRGAWKELQSGTMSQDERGHLGDRYKKPNHPTFSNQSIYSGSDYLGGTWTVADGKDVYTPGRKLSKEEANSLRAYFSKVETNAILNLEGKIRSETKQLPFIERDLGWFDGFGDAWKGLNAAASETASSILTVLSNTSIGTEQERQGWRNYAKQLRANSKKNWDADPETMGAATQIIHGFWKMMPKAIGYGFALGPAGGALAYGADVGIQETQRLKDEGVDEKTAINAGMLTFATNAIGLRMPAAYGSTRIGSAVYGAGINLVTEGIERKGIQFILENQNYDEIAKQYDLSWTDMAISAGMGAAFGAVTWRSPEQIRLEKMRKRLPAVMDLYKKKLIERGFTEEEAEAQARPNARAATFLLAISNKLDVTDEQIAKILVDDGGVSSGKILNMPVTQGFEWEMGPRKGLSPNDELIVVTAKDVGFEKDDAIKQVRNAFKGGIVNEDTGFNLIMSNSDVDKSAGKDGSKKRQAFIAVANDVAEIAKNAKLVESHADVDHKNPRIRGIHVFVTPVDLNGELWRVQLLVKDSIEEGDPRSVVHSIDGIIVEKVMEKPPVGENQSDGGFSYASASPEVSNRYEVRAGQFHQGRTVSLSRILGGLNPFLRKDKKGLFDDIDPLQRNPNGVYYDWTKDRPDPSVNRKKKPKHKKDIGSSSKRVLQQIGQNLFQLAYHGTPYVFDRFTLDHIGSGEGAQVHGWGLYFALNKAIALAYKERLTNISPEEWLSKKMKSFLKDDCEKLEIKVRADQLAEVYGQIARNELPDFVDLGADYFTGEDLAKRLGNPTREEAKVLSKVYLYLADELAEPNKYADFMENVEDMEPAVRDFIKAKVLNGETYKKGSGRLYTVDIPEDNVMMREENFFEEQSEEVQNALEKIFAVVAKRQFEEYPSRVVGWKEYENLWMFGDNPRANVLLKRLYEIYRREKLDRYRDGPESSDLKAEVNKITAELMAMGTSSGNGIIFIKDVRDTAIRDRVASGELAPRIDLRGMSGRKILQYLESEYGSPKAAAEILRNNGVLGMRYYGRRDGECAVVWSEEAIKMMEVLEQNAGDVKGRYDIQANEIHLTPNADISTFSHEHAHWYMTKLIQFAGEKGINAEVIEDAEKLLNAMGIKSLDEWNSMSFDEQAKYHERFASWTEIYLSKGQSPVRGLEDFFKRLGEWLMDLYRGEEYRAKNAEEAVGGRYKGEFGEDLPPLSSEVKACLDRMYGAEKRSRIAVPTGVQAAAARIAQTQRVNDQKVVAPMKNPRDPDVYRAAINAQRDAAESLNSGEKVDVSEAVRGQQLNDEAISDGRRTFTRAVYVGGNSDTIVTLQNRNRDTPASQMQMNNIAGSPEYGRLSISRTTDSGAPIVSFGEFPADEFVGVTGYVMDGGQKVQVTYAVVEADSVQTSNFIDGRQNPNYAKDFSQMQAVAGNGRMTGLQEAFNRNSADQYVKDLIDDYQQHGVDPEAIRKLKKPVLVRIMPKEKVSSGFVDRSNQSQVLDMSGAEQAVRDSEKLAGRKIAEYEFDKNGEPTSVALKNFLSDIGEPTALGSMTDANGYPTLPARNRIKAAVFYYAYRDPELTALAFDEMDKQGIKRILNAMMVFAPHVIDIRRASNGAIDIGPLMTEAVNMIRSGRKMDNDILITEDNAAANPGVRQFMELFSENRDSAAAITRITDRFANDLMTSLGEGSTLLGDPLDTADALSYLRRAQNALIAEDREKGGKGVDLPDIDVAAVRETMKAMKAAERPAEQVVQAMAETAAEKAAMDAGVKTDAVNTDTVDVTSHERAQAVFTDDADRVRVENLSSEKPDQTYLVVNDEGREVEMTAAEVLEHQQKIEENAKTDADGMGKATECIIRNGGIE